MNGQRGLVLIGSATAVAGIAGYVITWLVPRSIGFGDYSVFAIFWAFIFLAVAALSGIQQEVTRATHPRSSGHNGSTRVWLFALAASLAVFVLITSTAGIWVDSIFPNAGWLLVWPLAAGTSCYVFLAVLTGSMYGIAHWSGLFWVIVLEAVLRLAAIAIALSISHDVVLLAWGIAMPFPVTVALVLFAVRKALAQQATLDTTLRQLTWNTTRTVVATASMGMLISGFPLILGLSAQSESKSLLGLVILASTLVRAPLIVTAMAMQSYLIVLFRNSGKQFWKVFLGLQALVAGVCVVFAIAGYALGPAVFAFLFPGEDVPTPWFIALLIVSSGLVGALCISAPAVLAQSQHSYFTLGWVAAAVATIGCLFFPSDLVTRTLIALIAGPLVGLAVHCTFLVITNGRSSAREAPELAHRPNA